MTAFAAALAEALARIARANPGLSPVRIIWTELLFAWRDLSGPQGRLGRLVRRLRR